MTEASFWMSIAIFGSIQGRSQKEALEGGLEFLTPTLDQSKILHHFHIVKKTKISTLMSILPTQSSCAEF